MTQSMQNCDPPNELSHPYSLANRETARKAMHNWVANPACPTCRARRRLLPFPGYAWGWETMHDDHCPEHDDNQSAPGVQIVGLDELAMHGVTEAIWDASIGDEES